MRLRRPVSKRDGNHDEIVSALRAVGASVFDASAVGKGFPDIVVGWKGVTILVEVKMPKCREDLTPLQIRFHDEWRGTPVFVVTSKREALALLGVRVAA